MADIVGKVGDLELSWDRAARGATGTARVTFGGRQIEVRWRKDADGIWIETPSGVFGFDIEAEPSDENLPSFRVARRKSDEYWTGVGFMRAGDVASAGAGSSKKKGVRVRAQMPGKIVRVLVKQGAEVQKDQALVVMEAMKMENEIRATQAGVVASLKVSEGQTVETGADLLVIE